MIPARFSQLELSKLSVVKSARKARTWLNFEHVQNLRSRSVAARERSKNPVTTLYGSNLRSTNVFLKLICTDRAGR